MSMTHGTLDGFLTDAPALLGAAMQQGGGSSGGVLSTTEWAIFGGVVVVMLIADMLAHRGERAKSQKSAAIWSAIWIGLGLAFTGFVWWRMSGGDAQEYIAVYALEKSLSLDNLFVFYVIFHSLNIPDKYHHKVLYWGILGALVFRLIFIYAGAAAVEQFAWVEYVFGALLLGAAWRTWREDPAGSKESALVLWLERHLPFSRSSHGGKFFDRKDGQVVATALFVALVAIELSDIMFAIDSVAAALSITTQEFIIYSANIFAILGLRSLYLLLEHSIDDLHYLHYGLAMVLGFAALKLLLHGVHFVEQFITPLVSVAVIVVIIGASVIASVRSRHAKGGDGSDGDGTAGGREADGERSRSVRS